jgi:hypothetical protein
MLILCGSSIFWLAYPKSEGRNQEEAGVCPMSFYFNKEK